MLPNIAKVDAAGVAFEPVDLDGMEEADVIISITSAFSPSLMEAHVSPARISPAWVPIRKANKRSKFRWRVPLYLPTRLRSLSALGKPSSNWYGSIESDIVQIGAVINGGASGAKPEEEIT